METKRCPECGGMVEENAVVCTNCGYRFGDQNDSLDQSDESKPVNSIQDEEQTGEQYRSSQSGGNMQNGERSNESAQDGVAQSVTGNKRAGLVKILRNCLIAAMIIFALFAAVFWGRANNVRTVYRNSDYYYQSKNAYVGGDAYNYIINGTYFTGYSVTATGCMVCAVICAAGVVYIETKKEQS